MELESRDETKLAVDADMATSTITQHPINLRQRHPNGAHVSKQRTLQANEFHYLHLTLVTSHAATVAMDEATAVLDIQAALRRYLGLTGAAIPIDILKIDKESVWVRIPHADAQMVTSALGSWTGGTQSERRMWKIEASSEWLLDVIHCFSGGGGELFTTS